MKIWLLSIALWALEALNIDPAIDLPEWSDSYRILSGKGSAEPGRWHTDRTPYLREIMGALSPSSTVRDVWVMKGAQLGLTEMGVNWIGYVIDRAPGPMLWVSPTLDMSKKVVKQRIDPLIQDCPAVAKKVPLRRAKDGGNSLTEKEFPGGALMLATGNSAAGLRSMPIRYLGLDEIDAFPIDLDGEGDPAELAKARTRTFRNAKRLYISTPTIRGLSRIEKGFESTDQRYYFVPCPHCGEFQTIEWSRMHWDGPKAPVWLECEHNGCVIEESHKTAMLAAGEWRATCPENEDPRTVGYHISSLYSPVGWYSWADARDDYEKAKDVPQLLKTFTNTVLGLSSEERGDAPAWRQLYARRETYKQGHVPAGGLLLTAGVDVQQDRIEAEIRAWGKNAESWSVDYRIFHGDTINLTGPDSPWEGLDRLLRESFPHELGGDLKLQCMAVDSGYRTQTVYAWGRKQDARRVAIIKGRDTLSSPVSTPTYVDVKIDGKRIKRGIAVWKVASSIIKSELYASLRREPHTEDEDAPTGWVHFPEYGEEYFLQLCAEELVTKVNNRGYLVQEWKKNRERNEALDCAVYARAASIIAGLDRMTDRYFDKLRESLTVNEETKPTPAKRARRRRRENSIWD